MTEKEVWKAIPNYEGYYEASSLGRIRSLDRDIVNINGKSISIKGRVMSTPPNSHGYRIAVLSVNGVKKVASVHHFIAVSFLGYDSKMYYSDKMVIDHINEDKLDNRVSNLQIITERQNIIRSIKKSDTHSRHIGVSRNNKSGAWTSYVYVDGCRIHIGSFRSEEEALAYRQMGKDAIDNGMPVRRSAPLYASCHKGVSFDVSRSKWKAHFYTNGKNVFIGRFKSEEDAKVARDNYIHDLSK